MAEITPAIRQAHGLAPNLIPAEILKAIDQSELLDRLTYAKSLAAQAQNPAVSPAERRRYAEQARNVIRAQPRRTTEQETAALIAKASGLGRSAQDAARREARELLERHPPAPRRPAPAQVAKAKTTAKDQPPVPVFDSDGNLIGVVDPGEIIAVAGAGKTKPPPVQPAQQAAPAAAAGQQVIKSLGPAWLGVHDWTGRVVGAVRRADVAALTSGRVAKSTAPSSSRANVYDARRRLIGQAPMSAIIPLASLRARAGRRR